MAYDTEKKVALDVALAAAHLCDRVRQEIVPESIEKDDRSPVTVADFGSQAVICQGLGVAFPQDPIVGEEDSTVVEKQVLRELIIEAILNCALKSRIS
ncbi:hypothetical protein [Prochlorothrix hollandica]|uniref:Uncharacterized protein n=1 Tax=Prochlorothrix hollandica PCC 9006 = CALU 1027 TaxID=317619 RepID=A0A0M2PUF9_PROHO|nr:hypothetical protein [Prochlorothrix hollandica]KKI99749.1 hypothetical protein PROH_07700 [Prochlorothrix hollandica PCC 9006 = CALU 1027]